MEPDRELLFRVFNNPVIFDIVSGYLDLEDLKRFRCVNKDVNEACLPVILKRAKAQLIMAHENGKVLLTAEERHRYGLWHLQVPPGEIELIARKKEISSLTTLISNSSGFPCSKFVLGTGVFSQQQLGDDLLLDNFLSAISGFVTELELQKEYNHRSFYCETSALKVQFEQLKVLKIVYKGTYSEQSSSWYAGPTINIADRNKDLEFFADLFWRSPDLTTLHLESQEEKIITPYLEDMRGLQWEKLKNLSLTGMIKSRHFKILTQLELKLKSFSVSLHPGSIDTIPRSFLESQSSNLELLAIKWPKMPDLDLNCDFRFPRMSKLKTLIADGLYFQENIRFPGLSFEDQFPALNDLSLYPHSKDFFPSEMKPLTTVTSLALPDSFEDTIESPEIVKQTARVFPRVKTLTMHGHLALLQSVNAHMPNVTELTIRRDLYKGFIQALSGYTREELIKKQKNRDFVLEEREPLPIFKRLQILRLQNVDADDFMCEHGLLKCTSLVILDLMESPYSRISQSVLVRMRQQFKVHLKSESVIVD